MSQLIKGAGRVPRSTQIDPATLTELAVITGAMPEELRLAVQLGAWRALRYGEVFELRRKGLDITSGVDSACPNAISIDRSGSGSARCSCSSTYLDSSHEGLPRWLETGHPR
jgi:hypothetical protein